MISDTITTEDLNALRKVLDSIEKFSKKIKIRRRPINFDKIRNKINENLISNPNELIRILRKLKSIIRSELAPEIYYIFAAHGGIIINDIGFCEFDFPHFAMERIIERMNLAITTRMPYGIEIAVSCLEWVKNNNPGQFSRFSELFRNGKFEIINPSYSQPYSLIVGAESNIKQFEYGIKVMKELGLNCNIYYASECSVHPQIPQILKGFRIDYGSLRTRLLGMTPTTPSGNIDWKGLDDTKIHAITDQSGTFNGEYWHGTFFEEIPNLLFQAVARPFMQYIVYSSLEDFVMPMENNEEVWRISKFIDIFGKFIACSEFFTLTKKNGEFKFPRDQFMLGNYIFFPSELYLTNKNCESRILLLEVVNSIIGLFQEESLEDLIEDMWKKYLLTQAHDNYAVPFIGNGDYSRQQLNDEELNKLDFPKKHHIISELSVDLQKKIIAECDSLILETMDKLASNLVNESNKNEERKTVILVFNPTIYDRRDIVEIPSEQANIRFIDEVPSLGYKIFPLDSIYQEQNPENQEDFHYNVTLSEDYNSIEVHFKDNKMYELSFETKSDYSLELIENKRNSVEETWFFQGNIMNDYFKLKIIRYIGVNRLEFELQAKFLKGIVLKPSIKIKRSLINYPFGIEETKRTEIQTLDFLWLISDKKGILFSQKNSQKFSIDRENFEIKNIIYRDGFYNFSIAITKKQSLYLAHKYTKLFNNKLIGIRFEGLPGLEQFSKKFLKVNTPNVLINMWRRGPKIYLRILNASSEQTPVLFGGSIKFHDSKVIDFKYNELEPFENGKYILKPWKILTVKI